MSIEVEAADLILQVINLFGMGEVKPAFKREVDKIYKRCGKDRIATLAYVAALIPEPATSKEMYAVAKAYQWAGAKYRQQAIEYTKMYLDDGAKWTEVKESIIPSLDGGTMIINSRASQRAWGYRDLGKLYEGEYMFEEAALAYAEGIRLLPNDTTGYVMLARLYVKMGKINEAIDMLENKAIELGGEDARILRVDLQDLKDKKARGYVYRPRKRN